MAKIKDNIDETKGIKVEDNGIEIPEGMIMNPETGDFEPDPNYVPPAEKGSTASKLNKRMAEMRGQSVSEIEKQEAKDSIPEGKMVNDAGEFVDDPNYIPPTDNLTTNSTAVSPDAPVADAPKQEGNKSLLNIDNLKLGYVGAEDKNGRPVGEAKLVSE